MRIGFFSLKFPYRVQYEKYPYGGSTIAAYHLAINMAKRRHNVNIFTTSATSKDSFVESNNLKIYRYGTDFRIMTSSISLSLFYKPLIHNSDIVHVHFDIPPGPFAGLRYAKKKDLPLVVTYHGDWEERYGNTIRRLGVIFHNKLLVDKILSNASVIISPSEHYVTASSFLLKYKDKVVAIPNGIDFDEFDLPYSKEDCRKLLGLPFNKKILLFIGNLVPQKGTDVLLQAMTMILKELPDTLLIVAGKGNMRKKLQELSLRLGIETNVIFSGYLGDEKRFYYKASDLFVIPSLLDCFPIVNLEAMACGIPIVASKVGGIPDAIKNGENGLLVRPGSPNDLSDAIIYLLQNERERKLMGENGKKKVKCYSWEKIAEDTEKIYKELS